MPSLRGLEAGGTRSSSLRAMSVNGAEILGHWGGVIVYH